MTTYAEAVATRKTNHELLVVRQRDGVVLDVITLRELTLAEAKAIRDDVEIAFPGCRGQLTARGRIFAPPQPRPRDLPAACVVADPRPGSRRPDTHFRDRGAARDYLADAIAQAQAAGNYLDHSWQGDTLTLVIDLGAIPLTTILAIEPAP